MQARPQAFWALNANPDNYRIEDAVAEVEFDNWVTKGSAIQAGDRAIIWKGKGERNRRSARCGIVALAEIVDDPAEAADLHPEYQRFDAPPHHVGPTEEMVTIQYVRAPNLPLWLDGPHHELLSQLSIVQGNARRSVYHVQPDQWAKIVEAAGGWPVEAPGIEAANRIVRPRSTTRASGQGFSRDAEARGAIEDHAMCRAEAHYRQAGWHVEDVSKYGPYDLHCSRPDGAELRVEVKGTTSVGSHVLLTRNEVEHARRHHPHVALFVVSSIRITVTETGRPEARGGEIAIFEPWSVDAGHLTPIAYAYELVSK